MLLFLPKVSATCREHMILYAEAFARTAENVNNIFETVANAVSTGQVLCSTVYGPNCLQTTLIMCLLLLLLHRLH